MNLLAIQSLSTADLAYGILDLSRLQMAAAAHVALISPSRLAAVGAFSLYISVRQEALALGAVGQLYLLGIDVAAIHQGSDHLLGPMVAGGIIGVPEVVEIDLHLPKDLLEVLVVLGYKGLGSQSPGLGIDYYGSSMSIRAADEENLPAHLLASSDENIRRHISS